MKPPWTRRIFAILLIVSNALFCNVDASNQATPVRLVGGTSKYAGRLEVNHDGVWGTVCDYNYANNYIADVVCKQLGSTSDVRHIKPYAYFGAGTGPIWMNNVRCTGTEISLDKCVFNGWGNHNCDHHYDLSVICTGYVSLVSPNSGSLQGGTTLTIEGVGFSRNNFNHFPGTEHLGNKVYLVNDHFLFSCDVIVQKTSTSKIICLTPGMPQDYYKYYNNYNYNYYYYYYFTVQVTVDGVDIPSLCGYYHNNCYFQPNLYSTPTIEEIIPSTGPPGTLLTLKGLIFTSKYGLNASTNGREEEIARVMAGGDMCDLKSPDGQTYGIALENNGESDHGFMACRLSEQGSKIGNFNVSFTLSVQGRSRANLDLYTVSRNGQIFMFQSYAEIDNISPSSGSTEGGTLLTIKGMFSDGTLSNAVVKVQGTECHVIHVNETTVICRTSRIPNAVMKLYPGNRGIIVESWNETLADMDNLEIIESLNESFPDYQVMFADATQIPGIGISNKYVNRMKGFFMPPFDGEYQLVLNSTEGAQLYLSTDEENLQLITSKDVKGTYTTSKMLLYSNQSYYMEVFYRQSNSSMAVNVAVRYLDSIVNHYMAGNVQQEEQEIRLSSTIQKEQQTITIPNISNQTTIYEEQVIIVEDSDKSPTYGRFRLGMYSVYTESISVGVSAIGMMNALQALPVFDKSETVTVNRTVHGQGFKYTITFVSERGNFPLIEWTKLSGTFSLKINTTKDGTPSGRKVGLMMAGIPAPLIDSDASQIQISDIIEKLFIPRCPTYWTNPKRIAIHHNMEDNASLPLFMRGYRTNQYQAFCGNWILRNPYSLYDSAYSNNQGIDLAINPMFCVAVKGFFEYVYMYFDYTEVDGRRISGGVNIDDMMKPMDTEMWNYGCYNLQNSIKVTFPDATNIILRHLNIYYLGEVLIDEVYFGQQATTSDTEDAYMRRLICSPNGYKITDVHVTKHDNRYNVTLTPVDGGHGFPLFTVDNTQLPPDTSISVVRTVEASPPLSGTFDLTLRGQTITSIPVGLDIDDMEAIVQEFKDIGVIKTTNYHNYAQDKRWRFSFDTYPGNVEQIQMNASSVFGIDPRSNVRTIRDGEYRIDPLYGEMLQTAHDIPQVNVMINDVPSKCTGSCTFEWLPSSTPVINNASRAQEPPFTTIEISGTGFSETPGNNNVTIAGVVCNVTMATNALITCDIDKVPSGEHTVAVDVQGSGLAKYGNGNVTISFSMQIDNINPTRSGLGGYVELSITGFGFSENSSVTVGAQTCDKLFVNTTNVICLIPPTNVAGTVPVKVDQIGDPVGQFAYEESITPRVTSISPTSTGVSGGNGLFIAGHGFGAGDHVTLLVDETKIDITFYNNSYATGNLPPCSPGCHHIKFIVGDNGAALTPENEQPSIVCNLEVTSVNPMFGSVFGGTRLTLTGDGFTPSVRVKVGTKNCEVITSTENRIICQIERIRTVHRVNNHGNHPDFGKYYYWNPQHVKILVGDIVRWDWDFPFYITTMKPKIEETFNMTAKYGKPGGFSSGGFGTATGFYSHEFSKAGTFYYWSGLVDEYSTTWFHGSVVVEERTSYLADVTVTLGGFEAIYNLANTTTNLDARTCSDTTTSRDNCSHPLPVNTTNITNFKFAFWICVSPVVYKISRQNGTTNDKVLISGDGFSSSGCANNVSFGDYKCKVSSSSVSSLICSIDPENKPRIGRPQFLDFLVDNLGYAHVNEDKDILKSFALFPLVNQISPVNGSRGGHTRLTISGTGFGDGTLSNMTEVIVGGYPCDIVSSSYTQIVCFTPRSSAGLREVSVTILTDANLRIPARCDTSCYFKYDDAMSPIVTNISPTSITGENITTIAIDGTEFGDEIQNVNVIMTSSETHPCLVTNVSFSQIVCTLTNLPVGENLAVVDIFEEGRALHPNQNVIVESVATISNISPAEGSIYGGTDVTVTGNGFLSDVSMQINGSPCRVTYRTLRSVVFTTVAHPIGSEVLAILSNGVAYPYQTFNFTEDASPRIIAIHPSSGMSGQNITITGFHLGKKLNQTRVLIGGNICTLTAVEDTEINCTVGNLRAGTYTLHVNVQDFGNSNTDVTFKINMSAMAITPSSGSLAGSQTVTILGTGFDDEMEVTICDRICNKSLSHKTESTQHVCDTPPSSGSSLMNCNVHVTVNKVTETLTDVYTYDPALTPVIDDVIPKRGGTQGGTRITISGFNFGSTQEKIEDCESSVTIAGTLCNITSWTNTRIVCVTEAHSGSERAFVKLETGCNGKADEAKAGFHFVDVWSSVYTWGGAELGLPTAGDIVVIQKGQTIVFDTNTPVLKMLVIQGGELVFDETDVELQAENILITDGGLLQVGTEEEPFQHKAIITLHGHHRSKELPIYGTKAIIVREGTLDLHGAHIPITWTKLTQSTAVGDTQIQLKNEVTWQEGDQIIISTTGGIDSQSETEVLSIASVAADNKIITLNNALTNPHLGNYEHEYQFSAEVALLTRNVVIRGYSDLQWIAEIKACPDGFDSDYFSTETCAPGRYGEKMGGGNFGAQVVIHTTDPTKQLTRSRIEFVEFYHVGQAFRLGRHPINFHMTGDMSKSYVRGCGIYDTFNRAINIRDTHNLLVERNVIYNVNGAAIVLEDGTETGNTFQYNLGVYVKGSSQLLSADISAATFLITNPNNTFRHNVAAGGTHFGYWFHLENTIHSPVTGSHRPRFTPLAKFNNNTAHSLGMYGLWIHPRYTPRVMYSFNPSSSYRKAAVIDNMHVWNCRKGIVVEEMGTVRSGV
ncbi:fibrocystin-L-like [Mizuhopecten yessoensis]|uniref:fibrocystin-L-like n=1 Tax=Mizuhopecten yessoensis TaxID=6573 RepID=UPI000B458FE8|nr:fibrocystin-L-like [Mizuhopecten yessoensis]